VKTKEGEKSAPREKESTDKSVNVETQQYNLLVVKRRSRSRDKEKEKEQQALRVTNEELRKREEDSGIVVKGRGNVARSGLLGWQDDDYEEANSHLKKYLIFGIAL
jgi:hypothetical protein